MKTFAYILAALLTLAGAGAAQAQSSSDTYVIHGTTQHADHKANRVVVKGDDGRDYVVDISQGHASGAARTPGQEVTVYGRRTGDNRIAGNVVADRDYRSGSAEERGRYHPRGWEHLHGTVQDVEGSRMRLRVDDGRTVRVDLSALPERREEMINHLRPGAMVTVIGDGDSRSDRFSARHVRFDDRDLNRRAWGGQASAASDTGETHVSGLIETIHKDNLRLRTDDGRIVRVDIDPVRDKVRERFKVGDRVTVIGAFTGDRNRMTARTVRADGGQSSSAVVPSGEQQVQGTVETIHKDNLRLRTDDGRIVRVDIDPVRDKARARFKVGDRVTVIGTFTGDRNRMTARTVRVDGGQSSSAVAPSGEQQVQGTVEAIHKDNMRLRTDDGRIVRVDVDPVRERVRERFKVGDRVTVIGTFTGDRNRMTARTMRVDDSPAASPATNRPRNADDCKDNGWRGYRNPSFKNQGDCVSHVNSRK